MSIIQRKRTRQVAVGHIKIGGLSPISIQSMTNTVTSDVRRTIRQVKTLQDAGCEIVRVAVKTIDDADAIRKIKRQVKIPIVCDIHFNPILALRSIQAGADKVRLNPGNIRDISDIEKVLSAAKSAGIPVRIGVNSGSVSGAFRARVGHVVHAKSVRSSLVAAALEYVRLFEEMDFFDIVISLKGSNVMQTIAAYREMSELSSYPLHLGITASGPYDTGVIKSAIGIGALLADGIGDTIRVSLTADPVREVAAGQRILQAVGVRHFGPEIISCPTCGRCQVDLIGMVNELERVAGRLGKRACGKKIALMGCEVNGPGEAVESDIGIAFGKGSGALFKKGKIIKKVKVKYALKELIKHI